MKLWIKDLSAEMELKNRGMEIAVCDTDGTQIGDLVVNRSGLTWCKGKTNPKNGSKITWNKFIEMMEG